ncbi:PorT family protein [Brachyspira aalborgi]|nr:PorT family protein [Brachyspira aalborgi]
MAMTMALGTSAFAASGFEFILNVPFGINWSIPTGELKGKGAAMGFDAGVDAQIGYMFQVKDGFGISVLGELGYSWDAYSYSYADDASVSDGSGSSAGMSFQLKSGFVSFSFHSFKLGLLPKFNIGFGGRHGLAVGIGGGVKIPIAGQIKLPGNNESLKATRKDIAEFLSPSVIGYIKASIDYYLFFTDNIAMEFGLYLGGDFGPKMAATVGGFGGNAFDFGLQLGFRFGPKA